MKEKIIIFIIGVLVGAVLATGAFFIYEKNNTSNTGFTPGDRPQMFDQDGIYYNMSCLDRMKNYSGGRKSYS